MLFLFWTFFFQTFGNFLVMLLRKNSIVPFNSLLRVDSKSNDGLNKN